MFDRENVPDRVDEFILRARHLLIWGVSRAEAQRQLVDLYGASPAEAVNATAAAAILNRYV